MASTRAPIIQSYKAGAAIAKGKAVKAGADSDHVAVCSAASDKSIGILQTATDAAEDVAEIAMAGGGAKALAGGTIAMGDMLVSDANGALVASTTNAEKAIAQALESAVANDIFEVQVLPGII